MQKFVGWRCTSFDQLGGAAKLALRDFDLLTSHLFGFLREQHGEVLRGSIQGHRIDGCFILVLRGENIHFGLAPGIEGGKTVKKGHAKAQSAIGR